MRKRVWKEKTRRPGKGEVGSGKKDNYQTKS